MKYISFILLSLFVSIASVSANVSEESACFALLSQHVSEQYGVDLADVEKDERTGERADLSSYDSFRDHTVRNPAQKDSASRGDPWYRDRSYGDLFAAKRNNIGTIQASNDYILTQFSGFGDNSAFRFPLRSQNQRWWQTSGDRYTEFRQNLVYTHHLLDGEFVSCGYLNITPKGSHSLQSLGQRNYKTNVFEGSGFEMLENSVDEAGHEFLVGKVSIHSVDYSDQPFFEIDLVTVAYNNESDYFNEFETFPLQVQAMKNTSAQSSGLFEVMDNFLQSVRSETCLELVHKSPSSLPSRCNGRFQSLSADNSSSFLDFFLPQAHAKLDTGGQDYSQEMQEARGMVIYDGLPYELFEKLKSIPDENFKLWLQVALTPNYEATLEQKQAQNELLTPEEEVFLACDIDYTTRMEIIMDFLEKLDPEANFDPQGLLYSNPKFGDCVIPYPDKRNIETVVEGSFASNQLFAEQLSATGTLLDDLSEELKGLVAAQHQAEKTYNETMQAFQAQIDAGNITPELEAQINASREAFETTHSELGTQINDLISRGAELPGDVIPETLLQNTSSGGSFFFYLIFGFLLVLGLGLVHLGVKKKK
ncbi:hypothetical protein MK079_00685 [Candidatus Gracilibacteria bacterium]|nr:hypothetical protein [Candidatus Gracilibacteria bacterium]